MRPRPPQSTVLARHDFRRGGYVPRRAMYEVLAIPALPGFVSGGECVRYVTSQFPFFSVR